MPVFLPQLNGLSYSEAIAEAAVGASVDDMRLNAYELWHPSMEVPVRVVMNDEPLIGTLEATAPRNPGEDVVFMSARITRRMPEESDQAQSPQVQLQVDNVSNYVEDALRRAREHPNAEIRATPWELIERVYMLSDTSAPHIIPVFKVALVDVSMNGASAILTAEYDDSANTSIPAITFTPEYYSGLLQ
jgi:hypothetical protein